MDATFGLVGTTPPVGPYKEMTQWAPNSVASLGPMMVGGTDMNAAPSQWIQRGNLRMDNATGALEQLANDAWSPYAGSGYDPSGNGTNERLQMMYGFNKAPSEMDPSQYMNWAVQNGWNEPSRSDGMTLGEALLMMGGAAIGAGALNGLGGAGAATAAASPGSLAAEWAALEGTPTLVMGGDLAAGGLGAFASEAGFGGLETLAGSEFVDPLGGAGEVVDSNFYFDDWGVGSNAAGDMVDAAGNRAWQDVAAETLRDLGIPRETAAKMVTGLSSSITSITDPKNAKQLISKALGGGSAPTKTGTAKTAAGATGGAGGINIFNAGGDDSGLADAMKIFSGGRSGMDSMVQAMSQSGKGN